MTDGNSGANYTVTFANNTTGVISAQAITVTAATNTKAYDGTTSAAAIPTVTSGTILAGDTGELHGNIREQERRNGQNTDSVGFGDGRQQRRELHGNLRQQHDRRHHSLAITVTAATNTKAYDGTTSAAAIPTVTSGTIQAGDAANFTEVYSNKNAGTGKTLTPAGSVTDGNGGANYAVTFANNTTGVISALSITVTAATNTKAYDGTTSAAAIPTVTVGAIQAGDTASFTEAYADKNVGTGKTLTPAGSVTDGNGGANYTVTFANNTTGVITARPITVTAATNTKAYDGTTSAAAIPTVTSGTILAGDTGELHGSIFEQERRNGQDIDPVGVGD